MATSTLPSSLAVEASDTEAMITRTATAAEDFIAVLGNDWHLEDDSSSDGAESTKVYTCSADGAHCCFCDAPNCGLEPKCFAVQFKAEHDLRHSRHNTMKWRLRFAMVKALKSPAHILKQRRNRLVRELEALDIVHKMTLNEKLDFIDRFGEQGDCVADGMAV